MLGGGDRIAERRVHHDHAASGGGRNVDVVDADAGAADDFQFRRPLEQLGRHFGGGADGEPIIVANDFGELFLIESRFDVDLNAALLEDGDGGGRELIGNKNARGHSRLSWNGDRDGRETERERALVCVMPARAGIQSKVGGHGLGSPLSRG